MNGNRRSKELYAHRAAMDKPQHRKGKRSITSRARSSAMDTWIEFQHALRHARVLLHHLREVVQTRREAHRDEDEEQVPPA